MRAFGLGLEDRQQEEWSLWGVRRSLPHHPELQILDQRAPSYRLLDPRKRMAPDTRVWPERETVC